MHFTEKPTNALTFIYTHLTQYQRKCSQTLYINKANFRLTIPLLRSDRNIKSATVKEQGK